MTAYDYTPQQWPAGTDAGSVRLAQLREDLTTLKGTRGAEYLRYLGSAETVEEAIAKCSREIAQCEVEMACFG